MVAFAGAGVVIGAAQRYARSVGDGDVAFTVLFAALFTGMALGVAGVFAGLRAPPPGIPADRLVLLGAGGPVRLAGLAGLRLIDA
ncbi:hypothetical protein [Amycolatopsis tolypomycina]|uniref:hypothetical protein n=1 Tax=Amycolatopsis tolypomycina TaxID=208445 RepID=UPI000B843F53|nr:hypothetical protein [Amycolatopsis tolypomycina]